MIPLRQAQQQQQSYLVDSFDPPSLACKSTDLTVDRNSNNRRQAGDGNELRENA